MTRGRIYRIPAGVPFAQTLARQLLERTREDPLALAQMLVLLPTRRACRTLQLAFLQASPTRSLLLPRLMPLGDLDADELLLAGGLDLPAAMTPRQRQFELARLISRHNSTLSNPQLLLLARALGRLLDDFTLEGVTPQRLKRLVEGDLSTHWQTTLDFLEPVLAGWPHIQTALGLLDPAERRTRLLREQASYWRQHPPADPVIVAGSTGSIPATAELLRTVLTLPQGEIVLPGLPAASEMSGIWDQLDVPHPLYELRQLLTRLEVAPEQVRLWPGADEPAAARQKLLHMALLPASCTDQWAESLRQSASGLTRIDCASEQEEAAVIALAMRETVDHDGQTAMLVTPDRNLGRRVAGWLQRWGLGVDDSAGTPLHKTENATFLRLLLAYARQPGVVNFLALMKHPMAAMGVSMSECRQRIRAAETAHLRSRKPARSLSALIACGGEHAAWLQEIADVLQPLEDLLAGPALGLSELLTGLLRAAEQLATTDSEAGDRRFWRAESGQTLANWASELLPAGAAFPLITPAEAEELVVMLMSDQVVRARYGEHPRLAILGPLEARLQQADLVILGGLNEGSWPALPEPDPWLSRPMRQQLGLKTPEERLGQEAHDFYTLAACPRVLLTRTLRQGGTPTVPARWLSRLAALLPVPAMTSCEPQDWLALARQIDRPGPARPAPMPEPRPPRAVRPRDLYVTQIEKWRVDPYALYAEKILRLPKLKELEPEPGTAERGTFYHAVVERFIKEFPETLPPTALARFLEIGEDELQRQGLATQRTLWWPRFMRVADWFIATERQNRVWSQPLAVETRGELTLENGFVVRAKADRIDIRSDGTLGIIDYKTGKPPEQKLRLDGRSLQLPLEGAIASRGNFAGVERRPVSKLTFWQLSGGDPPGACDEFSGDQPAEVAIARALTWLDELITRFDDPDTPYLPEPGGSKAVDYSNYRHLARVKEWALSPEEEEEKEEA